MSTNFDVSLDNYGRIDYFRHVGGETRQPAEMSEVLDGGERLTLNGVEYDVSEHGSLVACTVELPDYFTIGSGVRIGPKVEFPDDTPGPYIDNPNYIGSGSVIDSKDSQYIHHVMEIGSRAVMNGRHLAGFNKVGAEAIIRAGAQIGGSVQISNNAQIGKRAGLCTFVEIDDGATIGKDVMIHHRTHVGKHATVSARSRIGEKTKVGSRYVRIGRESIIGHYVELGDHVEITKGSVVANHRALYQRKGIARYSSADRIPEYV